MSPRELKPIILYDIPCNTPGLPWSPNTMKTRYCLGYKGLSFTTIWLELPDIAGWLQSMGLTHPPYTLPVIEDPNTGALIADSFAIATYLDETYPETPKVVGPTTREATERVESVLSFSPGAVVGTPSGTMVPGNGQSDGIRNPASRLVFVVLTVERLNPVSKAYYHQIRTTRHAEQWKNLVKACAAGPEERAERVRQGIEALGEAWREATELYVRQGESGGVTSGGRFAFGKEPCFVDFAVAGRVKFALNALNPSEAETLKNLEEGRLGRLVEDLEMYYKY